MTLFKKVKHAACRECGVYFKARKDDKIFGEFCEPHMLVRRDIALRRQAVRDWAENNWRELEPLSKLAASRVMFLGAGGGGGAGSTGSGGPGTAGVIQWTRP